MKKLFAVAVLALASLSAQAQWRYEQSKNAMTDAVTSTASLQSSTPVQLSFPYSGATTVRLYVRTGRMFLASSAGQLLVSEGITIRFDDAAPRNVEVVGSSSGNARHLYVSDDDEATELAGLMAAAKRVRVRVTFYQDGPKVLEFRVAGLKVPG